MQISKITAKQVVKQISLFALFYLFTFDTYADENLPEVPEIQTDKVMQSVKGLHTRFDARMQNTIQWFDSFPSSEDSLEKASANGYLQLGLAPRSGDLGRLYSSFKVSVDMPNWEKTLKLIIDNDEDEVNRLNFETEVSPDRDRDTTQSLGIALRKTRKVDANTNLNGRVGFSRRQLYLRARLKWQFESEKSTLRLSPGVEYFMKDGVGAFLGGSYDYHFNEQTSLSFSAQERFIDAEFDTERKLGIYLHHVISKDRGWVTGVRKDNTFENESIYNYSLRYRQNLYFSWLFWEMEPFIESRDDHTKYGSVFSIISFFGTSI